MADVNALLSERLNKKQKKGKVTALGHKSASGNLSGFSGLFGVAELSERERETLMDLLEQYATDDVDITRDLKALEAITSEVKAINNQAALLHGERIKKAHSVFIKYQEGAFTAWLISTYGNRQTPYNLWQYYEFYTAMPKKLRPQVEAMPRQAVYTLASREGSLDVKKHIVESYDGETKHELLSLIRTQFPLATSDRRRQNITESAIVSLERVFATLRNNSVRMTKSQKKALLDLLESIKELIH